MVRNGGHHHPRRGVDDSVYSTGTASFDCSGTVSQQRFFTIGPALERPWRGTSTRPRTRRTTNDSRSIWANISQLPVCKRLAEEQPSPEIQSRDLHGARERHPFELRQSMQTRVSPITVKDYVHYFPTRTADTAFTVMEERRSGARHGWPCAAASGTTADVRGKLPLDGRSQCRAIVRSC